MNDPAGVHLSAQVTSRLDEVPVIFYCDQLPCVGVLTPPVNDRTMDVAVIIVIGGPQYRIGGHRQFVRLARDLAREGVYSFRFDPRGMGDSAGVMQNFEHFEDDIRAAIDLVCARAKVTRVVLWGLCAGASAAMMYATSDPRVAGLIGVNPWVRSEEGLAVARVKHYYAARIFNGEFWKKLLRGRVSLIGSAQEFLKSLRIMAQRKLRGSASKESGEEREHFLWRMHNEWLRFRGPTLVLLSGNDLTAMEFNDWIRMDSERVDCMRRESVTVHTHADADHTFSRNSWMNWAIDRTREWITQVNPRR